MYRDMRSTVCTGGAPRSACPFGNAPDVTAKGTAPPLFSIDGSLIEQRDSAGEMKRFGSMMVESSVLFLVAVVFSCSGDYFLMRQPIPPPSQP